MAYQVSWHLQHTNLDAIDVTFLWFYDKFYFMPINPFIHLPIAQRWSDRFFSGNLLMLLVSSAQLPALSQISSFSAQKPRLAQKQQHKQQQQQQQQTISSKPLQSLSKTSPGWVLTGCNLNEVRTRCKRGPNEVRNQILGDWPPKSPDILFGSHTLSQSFQNSKTQELSAVEQKRKPSQAAAAGKSKRRQKRRQRASKGDRGETKGPW